MTTDRPDDLGRLIDALRADGSGRVVVFLEGTMGMGKTAMIDALRRQETRRVVRTGPLTLGEDPPLGALTAAARALDIRLDERRTDAQIAADFAAVLDRDTVLAVDDVHWADDRSVRVLSLVLLEAEHAALLLAHRPTQVPHEILETARRTGVRLDRIRLRPLGDDAVRRIAGDVPVLAADRIVLRAEGNPLFARLLTQVWWERPDVDAFDAAVSGLRLDETPSVYGALRSDLRSLPADAVGVLRAVCVVGRLHVEAVSAISGISPEAVARSTEVLRARELLLPGPEGTRVAHPLIRAAAYRGIDAADRLRAHRAVAAMSDAFDELERAEHLHLLGDHQTPDESARVVRAAELALAEDAAAAVRWLTSTLHRRDPGRDVLLARALIVCGRAAEAAAVLDALDARAHTDEVLTLRLQALRMAGRLDAAHALLDDAVAAEDLAFQIERAALAVVRDDWDQAIDDLDRCARSGGGAQASLAATVLRALHRLRSGDVQGARSQLAAISETLTTGPEDAWRDVVDVLAHAAWAAYLLEEYDDAVVIVTRALRVARQLGHVHVRAPLQTVRAFAMVARGRLDEADRAATAAVEDARLYGTMDALPAALAAQLHVDEWREDSEAVARTAAELLAAGEPVDPWWARTVGSIRTRAAARLSPPVAPVLADREPDVLLGYRLLDAAGVALRLGDGAEARALVDDARAVEAALDLRALRAHVLLAEARVAAEVDRDTARAAALARSAQGEFEISRMPLHFARAGLRERQYLARARRTPAAALTAREHEIALLVAAGRANKEIGTALDISPRTVEEHVGRIVRKLGVASRAGVGRALSG